MNIIVLKATMGFQYEVVNIFAEELAEGFTALGHSVELVEVNQEGRGFFEEIEQILDKSVDLVVHFNGYLVDSLFDSVYSKLVAKEIPVLCILVDHPFYHRDRIKLFNQKYTIITMFEESHLDDFQDAMGEQYIITQLMHGGSRSKGSIHNADRKKDVIIAGTILKPLNISEYLEEIEYPDIAKLIGEVYRRAKVINTQPLTTYFEEVFNEKGLSFRELIGDIDVGKYFNNIFCTIDKLLRQELRYEVIKKLLENDIRVDLYGPCNITELTNYPNLHIHGPIPYEELLEEITHSKIVVHDLNPYRNGSHERVLSAMLNKTLVVANYSGYCNWEPNQEGVVFYHNNNLQELVDSVKKYLVDQNQRERITNIAYNKVNGIHEWRNRAEEILGIYNTYKEMC